MFKQLSKIQIYLVGSALFVCIGTIVVFINNKTSLHLMMNPKHTVGLDTFFKYATHLGDGFVTSVLALTASLLLFKRHKWSPLLLSISTLLLAGILSQFFKRMVFPEAKRPMKYIGNEFLQLVDGVKTYDLYSFPSGHTTSAFAFFALISFFFFTKHTRWQLVPLVLALVVGYSRIYLSQHFLEDVVAGALIGIVSFILSVIILRLFKVKMNY